MRIRGGSQTRSKREDFLGSCDPAIENESVDFETESEFLATRLERINSISSRLIRVDDRSNRGWRSADGDFAENPVLFRAFDF